MRALRPFVHPAALGRLDARFFPEKATIQVATITRSPSGEKIKTWVDLPGAIDLPARVAATPLTQRRGSFVGNVPQVESTHTIVIKDYLPVVKPDTHRVVLNYVTYDIKSVDWPERLYTVIEARQLSSIGANV